MRKELRLLNTLRRSHFEGHLRLNGTHLFDILHSQEQYEVLEDFQQVLLHQASSVTRHYGLSPIQLGNRSLHHRILDFVILIIQPLLDSIILCILWNTQTHWHPLYQLHLFKLDASYCNKAHKNINLSHWPHETGLHLIEKFMEDTRKDEGEGNGN